MRNIVIIDKKKRKNLECYRENAAILYGVISLGRRGNSWVTLSPGIRLVICAE